MSERDNEPKYPVTPQESRDAGRGEARQGFGNAAPQQPGETLSQANQRWDAFNEYKKGN